MPLPSVGKEGRHGKPSLHLRKGFFFLFSSGPCNFQSGLHPKSTKVRIDSVLSKPEHMPSTTLLASKVSLTNQLLNEPNNRLSTSCPVLRRVGSELSSSLRVQKTDGEETMVSSTPSFCHRRLRPRLSGASQPQSKGRSDLAIRSGAMVTVHVPITLCVLFSLDLGRWYLSVSLSEFRF